MTSGRSKGTKQQTKTVWHTVCSTCGATIINKGSGRPKKWCNKKCHDQDRTIKARQRNYCKRYYWKNRIPSEKRNRENNRAIVNKEKLRRGECELHPLYNNGERKFVIPGLEYLFDMDHIDRKNKHKTVAKMMKTNEKIFRNELAKCQLVCCECHRRKTIENKDWVHIVKMLQPEMASICNQPTLFDN